MHNLNFTRNSYGFWRQDNPAPFAYDEKYKGIQGTTELTVCLRLGFILSHLPAWSLREMRAVDVGSGNGIFARVAGPAFGSLAQYDLSGPSITREHLLATEWDMIIMADVLEHFPDIEDLFEMKWRYMYLAFPETPPVDGWRELETWRHFKPNEHIWMLNRKGMEDWLEDRGCRVLRAGSPEDAFRKPQEGLETNITSMLVRNEN